MNSECRDILKRDANDLGIANFRFDFDESGGRVEFEFLNAFARWDHSSFEQHGDDANRICPGHRRILDLFHDDKARVRFGMRRRQDQIAIRGWITARLSQHQFPEVVGASLEIYLLLEHRLARNVENATDNDASGFTACVSVYCRNHPRESQNDSSISCDVEKCLRPVSDYQLDGPFEDFRRIHKCRKSLETRCIIYLVRYISSFHSHM